ncbi:hypothetical protein ACOSP7_020068 [Xanthoceras sorbifolium]
MDCVQIISQRFVSSDCTCYAVICISETNSLAVKYGSRTNHIVATVRVRAVKYAPLTNDIATSVRSRAETAIFVLKYGSHTFNIAATVRSRAGMLLFVFRKQLSSR